MGVFYELGGGISINLWTDRWCGEVSLKSMFSDLFDEIEAKSIRISECFDSSGWIWTKILRGYDPGGSCKWVHPGVYNLS